jgi:DNA-directed RNA polymerase subunit RPC12/RpoP
LKKKCLSCGRSFDLSGSGKRQKYCSRCARRGMVRGRGLPGTKRLKTKAAKTACGFDLGSFVLAQIQCQASQPGSFITSDGDRIRIWTSDRKDRKGEEVYWRVNLKEILRQQRCSFSEPSEATSDIIRIECSRVPLTRLKPNFAARDPNCVQPDSWPRPWGYKVRLYIEAEKELQELGCGWRNIIVELDGPSVHLHYNGRTATMKRDAFKALLARNKRPKQPHLKLVVSNPPKFDERVSDAA